MAQVHRSGELPRPEPDSGGDGAWYPPDSLALARSALQPSRAPRWVRAAARTAQPPLPHLLMTGPSSAPQLRYLSHQRVRQETA